MNFSWTIVVFAILLFQKSERKICMQHQKIYSTLDRSHKTDKSRTSYAVVQLLQCVLAKISSGCQSQMTCYLISAGRKNNFLNFFTKYQNITPFPHFFFPDSV